MTNGIITDHCSPYEFLIGYLHMLGGSPDRPNDEGMSVSVQEDREAAVGICGCGNHGNMISLKFEKEWDGRLISFTEHTCIDCGRRHYVV